DLAQLGDGFIDAGDVGEGDFQVFLRIELVPAAAEGERRLAARDPADHHEAEHTEGHQEENREDHGGDAADAGVLVGYLVGGGDPGIEQRLQVFVEIADGGPPGNRLHPLGGFGPVGNAVAGDDLAAQLGSPEESDVLENDAGVLQDLLELAELEGD